MLVRRSFHQIPLTAVVGGTAGAFLVEGSTGSFGRHRTLARLTVDHRAAADAAQLALAAGRHVCAVSVRCAVHQTGALAGHHAALCRRAVTGWSCRFRHRLSSSVIWLNTRLSHRFCSSIAIRGFSTRDRFGRNIAGRR